VSPFEGKVLQDVVSPVDGFLFTLRTYPIVYEGSLLARISTSSQTAERYLDRTTNRSKP
jgi:predicted deacylase